MSWLDPDAQSQGLPGLYDQSRGPCQNQAVDRNSAESRNAQFTYSNVKIGSIGSTSPQGVGGTIIAPTSTTVVNPNSPTNSPPSPTPLPTQPPTVVTSSPPRPSSSSGSCAAQWQACTYDHSSCCGGLVCVVQSQWYAQCLSSFPPGSNCVGEGSTTVSPPSSPPSASPSSPPTTITPPFLRW